MVVVVDEMTMKEAVFISDGDNCVKRVATVIMTRMLQIDAHTTAWALKDNFHPAH